MTPDNVVSTSVYDAEISLMHQAEDNPLETLKLVHETFALLECLNDSKRSLRRVLAKAGRKALKQLEAA